MGTVKNDSAFIPLMTEKGTESWKPLEKDVPNEANRDKVPLLNEYSFSPPIAGPVATPSSFFSSIAAHQATGYQSATSGYPHIYLHLHHINPVENCVPTIVSHGKEGKSNKSMDTLIARSEGSNKITQASEFQNTVASGHKQSSDKFKGKSQPKVCVSFFEKERESSVGQKHLLNCVVAEGINTEKIYSTQEASHGHTLISQSNLNVLNSNASHDVPQSMVVKHTLTSVSPVLEGERITDVNILLEEEKRKKRRANTLASRRRRIRQKECEKLQAVADKLSSETSELKETLNNHSKECIRIRRENKALLEEIKEMCDPVEFTEFEAQNPCMKDDIPSESSSSDQSVDTSSDIEEAGSY